MSSGRRRPERSDGITVEVQIALTELVRRLEQPRLVVDPPPYRPSPVLRGPAHLLIEVEGVRESQEPLAPRETLGPDHPYVAVSLKGLDHGPKLSSLARTHSVSVPVPAL